MAVTKQTSLHGRRAFLTRQDRMVVRNGFVSGSELGPNIVGPSPDTVSLFDDFLTSFEGTGVADTGRAGLHFLAKCTDTGVKGGLAAVANGVFRITSSETITTATPAASSKSIVGNVEMWKAQQGKGGDERALRMTARVKASGFPTKTSGDWTGIFVGFTDTVAHEVPLYDTGRTGDSGASAVSAASDAVGFMWGTGGDTGWRGVSANSGGGGGANDSGDQQVTLTTVSPTANKWYDLELQMRQGSGDTGEFMTDFYIDGAFKGTIRQAVNPTVALTPVVSFYDTGGAYTCDVDYINVSAPRDTGE